MEEIKIKPSELISGEYVRTNRGTFDRYITKHKDNINNYSWYTFENRGSITNPENYIVKHNPNIIDLIEEGDYVNGQLVEKVEKNEFDLIEITTTTEYLINEDDIKDIVTKEMFNQVKYEV